MSDEQETTPNLKNRDDVVVRRYTFIDGSVRYKVAPRNPAFTPDDTAEMMANAMALSLSVLAQYNEDREGGATLQRAFEYIGDVYRAYREKGGPVIRLPDTPNAPIAKMPAKPHVCTDPQLQGHCTGCNELKNDPMGGTHQGCTAEHGHWGCDKDV